MYATSHLISPPSMLLAHAFRSDKSPCGVPTIRCSTRAPRSYYRPARGLQRRALFFQEDHELRDKYGRTSSELVEAVVECLIPEYPALLLRSLTLRSGEREEDWYPLTDRPTPGLTKKIPSKTTYTRFPPPPCVFELHTITPRCRSI